MKKKQGRLTVTLEQEQIDLLKEMAETLGVPVSQMLAFIVEEGVHSKMNWLSASLGGKIKRFVEKYDSREKKGVKISFSE